MTAPYLISLVLFSIVMSITPGPNNLLLTASGLAHGFRRTLLPIAGTLAGVGSVFLLSGIGIGALITADPRAEFALRIGGAAYLAYLAWKLWHATSMGKAAAAKPLTFVQVTIFQFANPKAWMMAISAIGIYVAPASDYAIRLIVVTAIFLLVSTPSLAIWAGLGALMKAALRDDRRYRLFNRGMAVLTAGSAVLILSVRMEA